MVKGKFSRLKRHWATQLQAHEKRRSSLEGTVFYFKKAQGNLFQSRAIWLKIRPHHEAKNLL